ncbi:hypothetical protein [Stakelama tenebrarum]|uniref:YARHG domain-containing protein n=1 Tax=Stakelama tenebrarum TaxID=2711215 RepID=A0A6G6Y6R6_9SPHN|nr:hypothetical protein [Sphingosinithalassobacter tenebrarum]QIG80599.1 hypothetical protein G5C33_12945 [Sphingosinithalassobacter tenebrarum]
MHAQTIIAALALTGAGLLFAEPAGAQTLSRGDYAQCEVYRNGEYRGLSQTCLERKRAQIRRYQRNRARDSASYAAPARGPYQAIRPCPGHANMGAGWLSTRTPSGGFVSTPYGAFDAPVNGRPCVPRRNGGILRGVR